MNCSDANIIVGLISEDQMRSSIKMTLLTVHQSKNWSV